MNLTSILLIISFLVFAIALVLGWEFSGRWAFLSSRTQARLSQAEMPLQQEEALSYLPAGLLERKLAEAGWRLTKTQFRLASIGLGLAGTLLAWRFFIPGLPALAIGGMLFYLPTLTLNERAMNRGLRVDEHLPLALSRIAAGLQAGRGLDEVLETTGKSLPGNSPLAGELVKSAQDIRTGDAQEAMQKLSVRSASPSLANVAMLLESFLRAGGGQYAGVVSEAAVQIQRIISVRNHARAKAAQALQSAKLIPLIMLGVLVMMASDPATAESFRAGTVQAVIAIAMGVEIGRIVYARGEVGKAADAAALAAASRIDVVHYRETGEIRFLPDVYATAQTYASMNSAFLRQRHIGVAVTGISVEPATRVVSVTVSADLSSLIPGILPFRGVYQITGTAEARIDGR